MAAKQKTDLNALQGGWDVVTVELDGQEIVAVPLEARITVKGGRFVTSGMGAEYAGDVKLDETARPKRFDLRFTTGPQQGTTALGIYELKGDSWRMCLTTRGTKRPTKFATKGGTGLALQTLVRQGTAKPEAGPPAKTPASTAAASGAAPELEGEWSMESLVTDGRALEAEWAKMGKRVVTGNEVKVLMGPQVQVHATFTVDRSRKPMEMNYVHVKGGRKQLGIYRLEGGILTTCMGKPGGPRPDGFTSKPGDGRTLGVWKKIP